MPKKDTMKTKKATYKKKAKVEAVAIALSEAGIAKKKTKKKK